MNVLRLHGKGSLELHRENDPAPAPGESTVRVTAVGICGSDLHWFLDSGIGDTRLEQPVILGHEFAGVAADGPQQGQRVAVDPAIACGRCEHCLEGNPNFCLEMRFAGDGKQDGALRESLAWPTRNLHPLPESLSDADGAMLEPLGVAIHSVDLGRVSTGATVGVFGCGPIGLLTIQVARAAGAVQIVATDLLAHRLDAARELGADIVLEAADTGGEREAILAATRGRGLDVTFETAGENAAVETAIETAKRGARVVLCGIPTVDRTTFTASTARRKGLTIKLVRRMGHVYPRAIRLVESGRVDVRSIVTHRFPLADAQQAFEVASRRDGLKVIVEP
jgi:L-iditol 2-dehydrogenase